MTLDDVEVEPAGASVLARRRRRLWVAVVVAVVLAVSCGVATRWIKSPAQAAADTAAPARTVLTAPVTTQVVQSSIVGRGSVVASLPMSIPAPAAGKSVAVVSAVGVPPGGTVSAGDVLLAVSGRPVIALPGVVPAYRDLTPGGRRGGRHPAPAGADLGGAAASARTAPVSSARERRPPSRTCTSAPGSRCRRQPGPARVRPTPWRMRRRR